MSLSSAKAKLDAQGGDPVTGYISKTDHQESYDELVDDTALTGATTAEALTISGTLNGRDPDNLVAGPASATDNALVRFDGTGGKTVQNSGITVDDSGYVTSDLTMSKSAPRLTINSPAGGARYVRIQSALAQRWAFGGGSAAEVGSNAGTDFVVLSYTDAEAFLRTDLTINRATGKWTFGSVGASAGLELGTSGPRVMSGTGSPEGVVTAPVGSMWLDTAATTGAIRWIKATGTGNTGWVVEYGDTGNRNLVAESLSNGWTASTFRLRRVGSTVTITLYLSGAAASGAAVYTLPSGFRPPAIYVTVAPYGVSADSTRVVELTSGGAVTVYNYGAAYTHYWSATWQTTDAWPSSLPGSAA